MIEKSPRKLTDVNFAPADDFEWPERSEYWRTYEPKRRRGSKRKFYFRQPLILCGHGVRLRVDCGTLLVQNGFTHYPQERNEFRFFPGDANLPDRIVMLDGSGAISFDAIDWMVNQKIALIKLNWRGHIQTLGAEYGYAAKPEVVEAQRAAQKGAANIRIARWLIREKIVASIDTLKSVLPQSEARDAALFRSKKWLREIDRPVGQLSVSKILGIEGGAAAAHFQAWYGIPLNWRHLSKKPIPVGWHEVGPRKMGWQPRRNQHARHPINAMMNYAYGMLVSQIRIEIAAAGLDPMVGVLHGTATNDVPLVYDLMEPLRPVAERRILEFALSHTFAPSDFVISQLGGCRLNPQIARIVVKQMTGLKADRVVASFLKFLRR